MNEPKPVLPAEVHVNMMNVVMTIGARDKTMTEEEAMMYNSFCDCLKAHAELDAVRARQELANPTTDPDNDDLPEIAPC